MKLTQSTLQRNFTIKLKDKTYYVNYLNSDGQTIGLINRDNWEVRDEEGEEINTYVFKNTNEIEINKNLKLVNKLINFCVKHFEDYQPEL